MLKRRYIFGLGCFVGIALLGMFYLLSKLQISAFIPSNIANAIIKWTPGDIATATIETLGVWGKRLIIGSSLVGFVAAFGVAALLLEHINRGKSLAVWLASGAVLSVVAFGIIWFIQQAVPTNKVNLPATATNGLSLAFVLGLGSIGLAWLLHQAQAIPVSATNPDTSRRQFLTRSAGAALSVAFGSSIVAMFLPENTIEQAGAALPTSVPQVPTNTAIPPTATTAATLVPGATAAPTATLGPPTATPLPAFMAAAGTRPEITDQESLYLISISTDAPLINPDNWQLRIFGSVDSPYTLTYDDLLTLPRHDQTSTMECISNEVGNLLIGNCNWNGVRLRDLLDKAGVQNGVVDVIFRAADGYSESLPLERALNENTLIAYGIDGQSLTEKHGFPARVRIAGVYGEKNVKWLNEIELVTYDYQGYWQQRGWTDDATIFSTSVYDTGNPRLGDSTLNIVDGRVELGGIAFGGDRGIRQVEVQIDGGEWRTVRLKETVNDLSWRLWRYDWLDAEPGKHTLVIRTIDGQGQPQVEAIADTHPSGATGYHTIEVEVR